MPTRAATTFALLAVVLLSAGCLFGGQGVDKPDPDQPLRVHNDWDQPVDVTVEVIRTATNETVHTGTYEIEPDEERDVYSTAAADPEGIEEFTFVVTARNETQRVNARTSQCYGSVTLDITDEGDVMAGHSIC